MGFSYTPAYVHPFSGPPPVSFARVGAAPGGKSAGAGQTPPPGGHPPVSLSLAQQAAILTNREIAAQVAAVQAEQHQANVDASNRAQQINDAALAASKYLSGLGHPAYDAYKDAGMSLAQLAQGYGGSLKDTAGADAAKVNADLAAVGSPQQALDQGQTLADVAYGRFGQQPGAGLLEQGAAAALRQSAVPDQVVGYGQNLAAEALANGGAAAAKLNPAIAQIEATRPATVQSLLAQFQATRDNKTKLLISQQLADSLIASRNTAGVVATTNAKTGQTNAHTREIVANNQASAADVRRSESDRTYRLQWEKVHGYDPITGQILPGYATDPATGRVVKAAKPTTGPGAKGALTQNEIDRKIAIWHGDSKPSTVRVPVLNTDGTPKINPTTGLPETVLQSKVFGQVNYTTALARLKGEGVPQAQALQALDGYYARGELGRAWLRNSEQAVLRANKLQAKATITKQAGKVYAMLTPHQAAVLKAHNMLPPGVANPDGWWLIAQTKE